MFYRRFFSMYFTFSGLKRIVRYTGDVRGFRYIEVGGFIEVPLYSVVVTDLQAAGSQTE